jgi:phage terminase large subunit GpA-like protein
MQLNHIGADWLAGAIDAVTDHVVSMAPVDFIEANRYLPSSVTSRAGPMSYSLTPYMREPLNCLDIESPVREVNFMKGVQVAFTTGFIESGVLYFIAFVKTAPCGFITADKEMATDRVENFFLPMINESGFSDLIRSTDVGNSRKTGKTKNFLQWDGGGFLMPTGAINAAKMRSWSWMFLAKDEVDGWKETVGKDGCPDKLSDDRCSGYWASRKIIRGSTPVLKPSKIYKQYLRGDCRKYQVLCLSCGFPQELRWKGDNKETGKQYGFKWEYTDAGNLDNDSVRYHCRNCHHPHQEHDKTTLFAEEHGAHWKPTKEPVQPNIRSYHLPAFYSPVSMQPWYKCVSAFLDAYDPHKKKVVDVAKYQVFYNNVLGWPFEPLGGKIHETEVSRHRRTEYSYGQVPNKAHASKYAGSNVLFVGCQVDVHKHSLDVAVMGWTKGARSYLIDYFQYTDEGERGCEDQNSPAWQQLAEFIENKQYTADNGWKYPVSVTFVDARYSTDTVVAFCADYESGVYPVLGRDAPTKSQQFIEFAEWTTKLGTIGYHISVDHYKDRLSSVLKRDWDPLEGLQSKWHWNAPINITTAQLKELTVERKREKINERTGEVTYYWFRPNTRNELWDLSVYGHAMIEVLAWSYCVRDLEMEVVDFEFFWKELKEKSLFFTCGDAM